MRKLNRLQLQVVKHLRNYIVILLIFLNLGIIFQNIIAYTVNSLLS